MEKLSPRSRGKRAGLNLEKIVRVARRLPPEGLTMQAVADELGVDRKALNYHVAGRERLLALVATESFAGRLAALNIPLEVSWQTACIIFADGFTDALIETGLLMQHLSMGYSVAGEFLEPAEAVLNKLINAGLDDESASRLLHILSNICVSYARDYMSASGGDRALARAIKSSLQNFENGTLTNISRVLEKGVPMDDRKQLKLGVEVFVRGVEALVCPAPETMRV